jgi:hypothetical protein
MGTTSAEPHAQINPAEDATTYYFQLGAGGIYPGANYPTSELRLGEGSEDLNGQVAVSGLQPSTAYHYRVVAINANGTTFGPYRSITTFANEPVGLPDNRAWEMVSPPDKNSGNIVGINAIFAGDIVQASEDGSKITYVSPHAFGSPTSAPTGSQYLSVRESGGWSTQNINLPSRAQTYPLGGAGIPYRAFSADLSRALILNGQVERGLGFPVENQPLAGAPEGYQNYYIREGIFGKLAEYTLEALLKTPPGEPANVFQLLFEGATPDLRHIVVFTEAVLSPGATHARGEINMYEWMNGQFNPINILPEGTPEPNRENRLGSEVGQSEAVSEDGARIAWTNGISLYVRESIGTSRAKTIQVDASQGGPESGRGRFLAMSRDGSKIFFSDGQKLTATSMATPERSDLYEFEVEKGQLTDLTVTDPSGAGVQGVLGVSEDGRYLYFAANGVLSSGASAGNCFFTESLSAAGAECNLYLWHEGMSAPTFIARVSGDDNHTKEGGQGDWSQGIALRTSRVTPDGRHLVFLSDRSITAYDNIVSSGSSCGIDSEGRPTARCQEVFLYSAEQPVSASNPVCISCNPSGERPTGPSGIPAGTLFANNRAMYQSRVLSKDGRRVFFESNDALALNDTNNASDVYEYENGQVHLISSGTDEGGAHFVDASANGSDVFFITGARLVGWDTDELIDLYDARENGGLPEPTTVSSCGGEDCRLSTSPPPSINPPLSAVFTPSPESAYKTNSTTVKRAKKHKAKKHKSKRSKKKRGAASHRLTHRSTRRRHS